jgi:sec-independent protein translocase protein TatC
MRRVRTRLLFVFFAFGVGASLTWLYRETIFLWLYAPAEGSLSSYGGLPIYTSLTEAFGATIGLALKGGLVAAFPVATYSVFTLLSPLLSRKQRRLVLWVFTPAFFLCYLGGASFVYFVMLPAGMGYLLNFGTNIAVPQIRISEYMSLVTALLFWVGVIFELPLVMFVLAKLKLVGYDRFKKFHKYVPLAAFIMGAIITPTFDMVNSTLVAVPIIALCEVGLFLSWLARPKEKGHRNLVQKAWAVVRRGWGWLMADD